MYVWSMDKEQQPLTGPSVTLLNVSRPLTVRAWARENDGTLVSSGTL